MQRHNEQFKVAFSFTVSLYPISMPMRWACMRIYVCIYVRAHVCVSFALFLPLDNGLCLCACVQCVCWCVYAPLTDQYSEFLTAYYIRRDTFEQTKFTRTHANTVCWEVRQKEQQIKYKYTNSGARESVRAQPNIKLNSETKSWTEPNWTELSAKAAVREPVHLHWHLLFWNFCCCCWESVYI